MAAKLPVIMIDLLGQEIRSDYKLIGRIQVEASSAAAPGSAAPTVVAMGSKVVFLHAALLIWIISNEKDRPARK